MEKKQITSFLKQNVSTHNSGVRVCIFMDVYICMCVSGYILSLCIKYFESLILSLSTL